MKLHYGHLAEEADALGLCRLHRELPITAGLMGRRGMSLNFQSPTRIITSPRLLAICMATITTVIEIRDP